MQTKMLGTEKHEGNGLCTATANPETGSVHTVEAAVSTRLNGRALSRDALCTCGGYDPFSVEIAMNVST